MVVVNCPNTTKFEIKRLPMDKVGLRTAVVAMVGGVSRFCARAVAEAQVWVAPVDEFKNSVAHFRSASGFLGDRIGAYRMHALSVLWGAEIRRHAPPAASQRQSRRRSHRSSAGPCAPSLPS